MKKIEAATLVKMVTEKTKEIEHMMLDKAGDEAEMLANTVAVALVGIGCEEVLKRVPQWPMIEKLLTEARDRAKKEVQTLMYGEVRNPSSDPN